MALPLDLAMEVWDSWPKAVGLTGNILALPCQSTILQHLACRRVLWLLDLSGSPPNKLALVKSRCVNCPGSPQRQRHAILFLLRVRRCATPR